MGRITSKLQKEIPGREAHALESFLIALACEGVDLNNAKFARALKTATQAIADHL